MTATRKIVDEVPCRFCPDVAYPPHPSADFHECPTCGFRYELDGRDIPEDV